MKFVCLMMDICSDHMSRLENTPNCTLALCGLDGGVFVALPYGLGCRFRLLLGGNIRGLMSWFIGVFFIPTIRLSLGVWSGTRKPFEILYTLFQYVGPLDARRSWS